MNETQSEDSGEGRKNFNALQKALEALKLAMENQLSKSGEISLEPML